MLHSTVTNQVLLTDSVYTNLDNSPEMRRSPILDQFVQTYNYDPLAIANYVQNEIEVTDALSYNEATGSASAPTVTQDGINRNALGVYLEGQGSPIEQCALLPAVAVSSMQRANALKKWRKTRCASCSVASPT